MKKQISNLSKLARFAAGGVVIGIGPAAGAAYGARLDEYLTQAQAMGYCRGFALDLISQGWGMERALEVMAAGEFPR